MPKGSNPNSRKALEQNRKKTQFNGERAVKAGKKSGESRKYMSSARNALKDLCTDDELNAIMTQLMRRGKTGNLTAIKMILDYTDIKEDTHDNAEVNIAFLAPVSAPETPPDDIEDEVDEDE